MTTSILLSLLGGILYVFSFAPWNQSYLAWIAMVPLFLAVEKLPHSKRNLRFTFLLGLLYSIVICVGGFYWLIYATGQYGGLPLWASLLVFLAFCLTGQLQVPLFLVLREKAKSQPVFHKSAILRAVLCGVFYAGIESFYPKLFQDSFGNAFSHSAWIRQSADLGGVYFLTCILLIANELFFLAYFSKKLSFLLSAVLIPFLALGYGYFRESQFNRLSEKTRDTPSLKFALIQANIGDYLKVAAERGVFSASTQVLEQYFDLSQTALRDSQGVDAIVWPETAYPAIFNRPLSNVEFQMEAKMKNFTDALPAKIIFGGYDSDLKGLEYNSVLFFDPATKQKDVYHKSILLQFGETLPFAETFPSMKSWFPTMGFFGQGPGPEVFEVKNKSGTPFKIAPSICYEGLFPVHSVEGALLGADVLLNVTNDSWFGPNGEPDLHLALTNFRSVETRLPMLRSTNTGYTVSIDPLGNLIKTTELGKPEILTTEAHARVMPEPPFLQISRYLGGKWFERLMELITASLIALLYFKRKSPSSY